MSPLRRLLLTLLATGLAATLVAYVFLGEGREEAPGDAQRLLPGLRADAVERLRVRRGDTRITVERVPTSPAAPASKAPAEPVVPATDSLTASNRKPPNGASPATGDAVAPERGGAATPRARFRVVTPRPLPADDEAIGDLLARLARLRPARTLAVGASLESLGLAPPRVTLEAETPAGRWRLELGVPDGFGGGAFARACGPAGAAPQVVALGEEDARGLDVGLQELRDRRLLRARLASASALRLEVGGATTALVRGEADEWTLAGLAPADEEAVQALLVALWSLRALRPLDEGEPRARAAHGLEPPPVLVHVEVGAHTHRLALARRPTGALVAADLAGGPVAEITFPLWDSLTRPPRAWRSPRALRFDPEAVGTLRWSRRGALRMVARMKDGSWQLLAPAPGPADGAAVGGLLRSLARLAAREPDDTPGPLERYGLAPAELEIAVDDRRGQRLDALHVGRGSDGERYARSARWPGVFRVDGATLTALERARLGVGPPTNAGARETGGPADGGTAAPVPARDPAGR